MASSPTVAFALGGLAGNNAHGAGFLEAALMKNVRPIMISCTSGQIYWTYHYLRRLRGEGPALREVLEKQIAEVQPLGYPDLDLMSLMLWGKRDCFKPAYLQYLTDWLANLAHSFGRTFSEHYRRFLIREVLHLFPCRMLVPDFPQTFFDDIAAELNDPKHGIGIVFNSYNPTTGRETVYLNAAARERLHQPVAGQARRGYDPGMSGAHRRGTSYERITPDAVRDGLWLYQYGFDGDSTGQLDGAYYRQIMLAELVPARVIYSVRPLHYHWSGNLPSSYPEMEDLKTKVNFNGSYSGERHQILLVSKLLDDGAFNTTHAEKYHHIELREIAMNRRRGFFDYLFEDMAVFNDAFRMASEELGRGPGPEQGPGNGAKPAARAAGRISIPRGSPRLDHPEPNGRAGLAKRARRG